MTNHFAGGANSIYEITTRFLRHNWLTGGARRTDAVLYVYIKYIMVECTKVILVENFLKMDFTDEQWENCQERVSQVKI